jgi:glycosyltransferase involved in cell wall biosynthesis
MSARMAVIIPALNEAATIADVVRRCREAVPGKETLVIVVDDGSTDNTAALAREAGAQLVAHSCNRGVGRAFRTGLAEALRSGAEVMVNIDADGQFDPARIPQLVRPILENRADFVSASRFKDPALIPDMPRAKIWGNRFMSRLISTIARQHFYDVSCGFRAYNREAALHLNLWGDFTYTQESFLELAIKNLRVEEVAMPIRGERETGESRVASNLWRYGWRTLLIILHSYRDYWPMHFFGWISLPFMLLGLGLLVGFVAHRLVAGSFSPHLWMGFSGAGLLGLGTLILVTGIMGEMLKRIRLNQEALIYFQKKAEFK